MTPRIVQEAGTTRALHLQDPGTLGVYCGSKTRRKWTVCSTQYIVDLLARGNVAEANLCGSCFTPERRTAEWVSEHVQGDVINAAEYTEEMEQAVEFTFDVSVMLTPEEDAAVDRADVTRELDDLIDTLRDEVLAGCEAVARSILSKHGARVVVYVQGTQVEG